MSDHRTEDHPLTEFKEEKEPKSSLEKELVIRFFTDALKEQRIDPIDVQFHKEGRGKEIEYINHSIESIFDNIIYIKEAITLFQQKTGLHGWKWNPRLCGEEREHIITKVIIKHLNHLGFFICDQLGILHYFDEILKRVVQVSNNDKICPEFEAELDWRYNIRKKGRGVYAKIISHAMIFHEKRDVHRLWYYDKQEQILYIHSGSNIYYRLNGTTVERFINGTHLLFRESKGICLKKYIPKDARYTDEIEILAVKKSVKRPLYDFLFNRCNFTENTNLSPKEQRVQLIIQIMCFPFKSIINTKPIMLFYGEPGSGKSLTLSTIGKFLFSETYSLSILPKKPGDYTVALANRPVYFTDNVDDKVDWLADIIVAVSSGANLPQRELYSNWTLTERLPQSFLAFTTRTAYSFKRNDVIDRALLFHVERITDFLDELDLWEPLINYHNHFFSEYLDELNKIVNFQRSGMKLRLKSKHRLAGWAKFAKIVNAALNLEELYQIDFEKFLRNVMLEKASFGIRDPRLLPVLKALREDHHDKWLKTSEIIEKGKEYDEGFEYTPQKLGRVFNVMFHELKILVGLVIRRNTKTKSKEYKFSSKDLIETEDSEKKDDKQKSLFDSIESKDELAGSAGSHSYTSHTEKKIKNKLFGKEEYKTNIPNIPPNQKIKNGEEEVKLHKEVLMDAIVKYEGDYGVTFRVLEIEFIKEQNWNEKDLISLLKELINEGRIYECTLDNFKVLRRY